MVTSSETVEVSAQRVIEPERPIHKINMQAWAFDSLSSDDENKQYDEEKDNVKNEESAKKRRQKSGLKRRQSSLVNYCRF